MSLTIADALALRGDIDSYERQEVLWLLAEILAESASMLRLQPQRVLTSDQQQCFFSGLARLEQGEPFAYIVGHQPFWTLDLIVTQDTLIPRPDSERLVEIALSLPLSTTRHVLDLGTGSGALALAMASERQSWHVIATDIHAATLAVADCNAKRHCIRNIQFYQSDWFEGILDEAHSFDLIVANPPYIAPNDPHLSQLTYEPIRALVAQQQGLSDLHQIINQAPSFLKPKGYLLLEHGFDQAHQVSAAIQSAGLSDVVTYSDYGGKQRATLGQYHTTA